MNIAKNTNRNEFVKGITVFELGLEKLHGLALILAKFSTCHLEPLALLALELTEYNVCEFINRYDWIIFS
jgi:hypothetical protein